jgi:eukaryotic-like serine/threonine-protein kinase
MAPSSLSGRRLGTYDVGPLVGAGGMGEVYRARDTKLNRDVAIKILLPAVGADADRLARFSREAQVLASLNHSNIAQIHGLEHGERGPFLVMEFVEGPTLAERIAQGPLPVDEALAIARQIADALEAAHERGIIHRDLKPANIKIRDDGTVKVLDFGLAKALESSSGTPQSQAVANSPTITTPAMTQAGLILGTAAYMSPEQAKGRVVDKRSDVWAFGCVLYEMLTGRRAFDGEDVTDAIAAVVRGEPDWQALPAAVSPQIRLLLKRCLEKDRRARIADISVARFLMTETIESSGPNAAAVPANIPARFSRRIVATALAAGLFLGAMIGAGAWALSSRTTPAQVQPVRFAITPPASQAFTMQGTDHDVAIAPDGSFIVYRTIDRARMLPHFMLRMSNELEARVLPGTAGARFPFVSADGRWVGFHVGDELRKVAITGGPAVTICRMSGAPRGASWGDDDFIVFASTGAGLQRVPASGGEPTPLTTVHEGSSEIHVMPHALPGGRWVLFTVVSDDVQSARVEAVNVNTGEQKTVIRGGHDAAYVETGHLVYATAELVSDPEARYRGSLRAVRFDDARVAAIGDSITAIEPVVVLPTAAANYGLSRRGDLVFVLGDVFASAAPTRTLVWVNRKGQETAIAAPPRGYALGRLSPDGTRIALDVRDQTNDIWIWDINRQTLTSLNRDPSADVSPVWTSDGKRIIWASTRGGGNPNLFWQAADGTGAAERLTTHQLNQFPTSTTPDGSTVLLFGRSSNPANAMDVFTVAIGEPDRKTQSLVSSIGSDFVPEVSPDGKWLAYHSNESGDFQVYVRPYPNVQEGRWQISTSGGTRAAWSRDGRELFYLDRDGLLTSVAVHPMTSSAFEAGPPVRILNTRYYSGSTILGLDLRAYDVSPDGQRFLMMKDVEAPEQRTAEALASMVVVLHWGEELKARLPAR